MKKTIIYLCAVCGLLSLAQPISANEINENADTTNIMLVKQYGSFIKDGRPVQYCADKGLLIIVSPGNDYTKPVIVLRNKTGKAFDFKPEGISVHALAMKGVKSKDTRYLTTAKYIKDGGKKENVERDSLPIYSYSKYISKVRNQQAWGNVLGGLADGAIDAMTYTPQSTTDRILLDQNNEQRYKENAKEDEAQIKKIVDGYWKENTIFNNTEHSGFIAFKGVKTDNIIYSISVNGEKYEFTFYFN
ncbi:hypothetical protein prwr041_14540 [Prevotella herbatica]|uniref:Uncharacterized protein n=1 Tax=Prevotella herbatica TaxID=2801997 RepID=A0ABM7NYF8_9BACT|nr:hypothetical protein [Prevotella herbatica]BCS85561.1 hypothetical protein prwr041_14540 [Prevotella herbatica]